MPRKTRKTKQRIKRKFSRKRYSRKKVSRKRYSKKKYNKKKMSSKVKKSKRKEIVYLGSMRKSKGPCLKHCVSVDIEGNIAESETFEDANEKIIDIVNVESEKLGFYPLSSYKNLLLQNGYYQDPFVTNFIAKNMKGEPSLENLKEVRIASFTNYYRCSIYALVEIIDTFLGNYADVVVSGGDGLNRLLEPEQRPVSPDIDVKVILQNTGDNKWLNHYKLVVVMTEFIIDCIICCLNGGNYTQHALFNYFNKDLKKLEKIYKKNKSKDLCSYINHLFYNNGEIGDFSILTDKWGSMSEFAQKTAQPQKGLLNYQGSGMSDWCSARNGCPWARRTSNMKAGNPKPPYTLMNVKLIAIDLRYVGCDYFSSLAGVLDVVIAVPGHVGHNSMERVEHDGIGYFNIPVNPYAYFTQQFNVWNISLKYYVYEMKKMIDYCLRTRNGKILKDLNRFYVLLQTDNELKSEITGLLESVNKPECLSEFKGDITELNSLIGTIKSFSEKPILLPAINKEVESYIYSKISELEISLEDYGLFDSSQTDYSTDNTIDGCDDDDDDRDSDCSSGGGLNNDPCDWKSINSESIGKGFENLNICDFFDSIGHLYGNKIILYKDDSDLCSGNYSITLNLHNKLTTVMEDGSNGEIPEDTDIKTNMLDNYRIDYEALTAYERREPDILIRKPFMLYSYGEYKGGRKMTVENPPEGRSDTFDTTLITRNPQQMNIASDILTFIYNVLNSNHDFVKELSQFSYFKEHSKPVRGISENSIHAAYILSSILHSMDPIKLQNKGKICSTREGTDLLQTITNLEELLKKIVYS